MAMRKFLGEVKHFLTSRRKPVSATPRDFALKDWRIALVAARDSLGNRRIGLLSAGVAFYATFAFFPLMVAIVAVSGFVISEKDLASVLASIQMYLPADIASLISSQLETARENQSSSTIIALIAVIISFISVSSATHSLIVASNATYEREESRSIVGLRLTSFWLLLANILGGSIIVGLLLLNEPFLEAIGIPAVIAIAISWIRWLALIAVLGIMLAVFYHYALDRSHPKWQWISWGSVVASVIWILGTVLFFVYARYFANFSESYSLFAGIIVLMTWFNLSAFIVLLGAEVNFRLEHTKRSLFNL